MEDGKDYIQMEMFKRIDHGLLGKHNLADDPALTKSSMKKQQLCFFDLIYL